MRARVLLAAAALAIALPGVALPQQAKVTRLRFAMTLPHDGNASTSLLVLPLKLKHGVKPKLRVVVKAEKPLPAGVVATYRAVVKAATLYIGPTFVVPHVLESGGSLPAGQFSFDTTLFATYTPGLVGGGGAPGDVALDVYLFDSGKPVALDSSAICNPCTFALASSSRKRLLRMDDVLSPHSGPTDLHAKLGFAAIVVAGADDVDLQGFVVNSHTSAFDLSVFGFSPAEIAGTIESGAADAGLGGTSKAATTLRNFARPSKPTGFSVTVEATHHHGTGVSNLCLRVRTSPAQSGSATVALSGPSGAGTKTVTLGSDGSGIVVFPINQYGSYAGTATVGSATGSVQYTVDASTGQAFSCPAP